MGSPRETNITFKVIELILSIATAGTAIYTELESTLPNYYCMLVVGLSGVVCFVSLQFICLLYTQENLFRPVMLLAAAVGAFLFFGLAIYDVLRILNIDDPPLIFYVLCGLFAAMALTLYIDAGIIFCRNTDETAAKSETEDEKSKKEDKSHKKPKKSKKRAKKHSREAGPVIDQAE